MEAIALQPRTHSFVARLDSRSSQSMARLNSGRLTSFGFGLRSCSRVHKVQNQPTKGMPVEWQKKPLERQLGFLATRHWKVVDAALWAILRRLLAARNSTRCFGV